MKPVFRRGVFALLGIVLLSGPVPGWGVSSAVAEDAPATEGEEPELTGKALKEHKKKVKALVKELHKTKNREGVRLRIERMGASGTRLERDALMLFATNNKNHEFVKHAFDALAVIGDRKSVDFLCGKNALRHKAFLIAQSGAIALGNAKDPRAASHILDVMLHKRTKIEVVSSCAIAAAKCAPNDERVIEALFKQSHHRKDTIRSNTLEALGYLASDDAVKRLQEALTEDKLARARAAAATGLGWTYRPDAIPILEASIASKKENSMHVRQAASAAIQVIRKGKR